MTSVEDVSLAMVVQIGGKKGKLFAQLQFDLYLEIILDSQVPLLGLPLCCC